MKRLILVGVLFLFLLSNGLYGQEMVYTIGDMPDKSNPEILGPGTDTTGTGTDTLGIPPNRYASDTLKIDLRNLKWDGFHELLVKYDTVVTAVYDTTAGGDTLATGADTRGSLPAISLEMAYWKDNRIVQPRPDSVLGMFMLEESLQHYNQWERMDLGDKHIDLLEASREIVLVAKFNPQDTSNTDIISHRRRARLWLEFNIW